MLGSDPLASFVRCMLRPTRADECVRCEPAPRHVAWLAPVPPLPSNDSTLDDAAAFEHAAGLVAALACGDA